MNLQKRSLCFTEEDENFKVRYELFYPYIAEDGAVPEKINAQISKLFDKYKDRAKGNRGFSYHRCAYSAYEGKDVLSLYFELESKGPGGAYAFTPFSLNFDKKGRLAPSYEKIPSDIYEKAKKAFREKGVKLNKKIFLYSYYLSGEKTVVFAPKRSSGNRKRPGVVSYTIDRDQL